MATDGGRCGHIELEGGAKNSDAKNDKRGRVCSRWSVAAVRTPCTSGIKRQKLGPGVQEYDAGLGYCHLRNNFS